MFDRVKLRPEIHPIEEIIAGTSTSSSESEPVAVSEPLTITEPVAKTEPVIKTESGAESTRGTLADSSPPPLQIEPLAISKPVAISEGVLILPEKAAHLRFPYEVFDGIMGKLKPAPRVLLERLYRLSAGWDTDICVVSIGKLSSTCKIGETQVRQYLRELEAEGYIQRIGDDIGNKNFEARGIKFRVLLPRLPPARNRTGSELPGGSISEPNKVNTQKENTQTQQPPAGVSVDSKFTIEECRRYAEHLRSTGQGINNPGGYATTIHRTGEADALIEVFLNPAESTRPELDASKCSDCSGTGFYYPEGREKGMARCKHPQLLRSEED
jgi:DNA-binding Lrp family transcriptional regulator